MSKSNSIEEVFQQFVKQLSPEKKRVFKDFLLLDEARKIGEKGSFTEADLDVLLDQLMQVDAFYKELGGLLGYQAKVKEALLGKERTKDESQIFHSPEFVYLIEETGEVKEWILQGIFSVAELALLIPLGGSADRLHLVDAQTGEDLPAARLIFAGKTLLEGLIRDLQAQEYLYYKRFKKQITVPVGLMTSEDKANHRKVLEICEEAGWFGRGAENFRLFSQPLVPTVDKEGKWCWKGPCRPLLKPGGHGALWKLAEDRGVFDWFASLGKRKLLVRQINNPIAGLDYGLLAFLGYGVSRNMHFGFASCPRLLHAAEGVNVLIEKNHTHVVLTSIEYCDFAQYGIEDRPLKEKEPYSRFSSNTNILFADLNSVRSAVKKAPYPGLLINMKKGICHQEHLHGRLESTMQNLADVFVEEKGQTLETKHTFVTYNHRHKTIATAKRAYIPGGTFQETPEQCFYELLRSARELLEVECKVTLPIEKSLEETLKTHPSFVFTYHPGLGPFYSLIRQKIQKGSFQDGSFCHLEIADLMWNEVALQGSLVVEAISPLGHMKEGRLLYSEEVGRCMLERVRIENRGVNWAVSKPFWKNVPVFHESVKIILHGHAEFIAKDVTFQGNHLFEVKEGTRLCVEQTAVGLVLKVEALEPIHK